MSQSIYHISFLNLLWIFIPVFVVIVIFFRWSLGVSTVLHGLFRMCLQLILVGYVLNFIFDSNQPLIIVGVLCIMLVAARYQIMVMCMVFGSAGISIALYIKFVGGSYQFKNNRDSHNEKKSDADD